MRKADKIIFDPTIYENLKVIIEGAVYDLDSQEKILITARRDLVDLSSMSRSYFIEFKQKSIGEASASLKLEAELLDLSVEILEISGDHEPGCLIEVGFRTMIYDANKEGTWIKEQLTEIWGDELQISQKISYFFEQEPSPYENNITVHFNRKINEKQLGDMESLLDHMIRSLIILDQIKE